MEKRFSPESEASTTAMLIRMYRKLSMGCAVVVIAGSLISSKHSGAGRGWNCSRVE